MTSPREPGASLSPHIGFMQPLYNEALKEIAGRNIDVNAQEPNSSILKVCIEEAIRIVDRHDMITASTLTRMLTSGKIEVIDVPSDDRKSLVLDSENKSVAKISLTKRFVENSGSEELAAALVGLLQAKQIYDRARKMNAARFAEKHAYDTFVKMLAETDRGVGLAQRIAKPSSSGISLNHLSEPEAVRFLLDYAPTGIIEVSQDSQAIIVYSDSLTESPALQEIIRSSKGDTRKFYLVNKESDTSADELLKSLNIDRNIFQRHVFTQNSLTPDQLALTIAGMLSSNGIRQGRVFASTEEDLSAWSRQGIIEALVMMLKDKRFEIISDYSQQHTDYIKTHAQALIAA